MGESALSDIESEVGAIVVIPYDRDLRPPSPLALPPKKTRRANEPRQQEQDAVRDARRESISA